MGFSAMTKYKTKYKKECSKGVWHSHLPAFFVSIVVSMIVHIFLDICWDINIAMTNNKPTIYITENE
jgi:hypothetical protein